MRVLAALALLAALSAPALAGPCNEAPPEPKTSSLPLPASPA